jgi:hypothetical protein
MGWYKTTVNTKEGIYDTRDSYRLSFDENDKIDVVNQYLDRATIMEAMKK